MLCKWCSGFCQKVCSLLWGFFVLLCCGFFCACVLPFSPFFFPRVQHGKLHTGDLREGSAAAREEGD